MGWTSGTDGMIFEGLVFVYASLPAQEDRPENKIWIHLLSRHQSLERDRSELSCFSCGCGGGESGGVEW